MHPLELALTGSVALVGPLLLGSHVVVLWSWFVWRQWEAAEGHCGYDFPWSPSHLIPGNDGARHHDAHHARVRATTPASRRSGTASSAPTCVATAKSWRAAGPARPRDGYAAFPTIAASDLQVCASMRRHALHDGAGEAQAGTDDPGECGEARDRLEQHARRCARRRAAVGSRCRRAAGAVARGGAARLVMVAVSGS